MSGYEHGQKLPGGYGSTVFDKVRGRWVRPENLTPLPTPSPAERGTPAGGAVVLTRKQFIVSMAGEIARSGCLTPAIGLSLARRAYHAFEESTGTQFGETGYAWDKDAARTIAREYEIDHWEAV